MLYAYNNIIINGVGTQGFEHHQSYILESLMPDSMYEAQIQAKNGFGWSQVSDKFQFYTRAYGEILISFFSQTGQISLLIWGSMFHSLDPLYLLSPQFYQIGHQRKIFWQDAL